MFCRRLQFPATAMKPSARRAMFFAADCSPYPLPFTRGEDEGEEFRLILLGLLCLALFLALVVLAHHFAVRIELVARFLAILFYDGFVVRALFLPANDFSAFSLLVRSLMYRGRHIIAADLLFLVFLSLSLRSCVDGETGPYHCNC